MRGTILVVDKDPLVLKTTLLMLNRFGYETLTAESGKQALELCENRDQPIHLLLTDIHMPEVNGYELANCMVEKHPQTHVLFMSGLDTKTEAQAALLKKIEATKWSILPKPFHRAALAEAVEKAIAE